MSALELARGPAACHTVRLGPGLTYRRIVGEFWTAQQRQMNSLHYVISYRGSFKPELPHFFITRYSEPGDIVFDPFMGRGTTVLEANLLGRIGWGNDANPLAERITYPKCHPVTLAEVRQALAEVDFSDPGGDPDAEDLYMFYHEDTLRELMALRRHLRTHRSDADRFVELIALSRLHGHSNGFFSVYSFPQISVPREAQARINRRRRQRPAYRNVAARIIQKARAALRDINVAALRQASSKTKLTTSDSRALEEIPEASVDLIVTSPPFLDKVDYITDNWLEYWFLGMDIDDVRARIVQTRRLEEWQRFISDTLAELARVLRPGGVCVIEVGDVMHRGERVHLDEVVVELARPVGLAIEQVFIQSQRFTKLAHCFNVENNVKGTNTNRCVVLKRR